MAELSYPTSGGGSVTDTKYEQLIGQHGPSGLIGIYSSSQNLVYADSTGRQVKVRPNRAAIVRGYRWETDSAGLTVPLAANSSGQPRYDRVVLRLDRSTWTVSVQVIQGTPSSSPAWPAFTQTEGTSIGVFEIPLALVYVANGAVTTAAGDVTYQGVHLGGWNYRGLKAAPPTSTGFQYPQFFYAYDNARQYANIDGSYQIIGEQGDLVSQGTGASGWDAGRAYYRRWNGFVYFQALIYRTGSSLTAGTDSTICTIPAVFRPMNSMYLSGHAGHSCRLFIDSETGLLRIIDYSVSLGTGAGVTVHPVTWPANNA